MFQFDEIVDLTGVLFDIHQTHTTVSPPLAKHEMISNEI